MSKDSPKAARNAYQIAPQVDSSCFLMPFINLERIKAQQSQDGTLRYFDRDWHTKEEWFLKTFPAIRDWHLAMNKLTYPQKDQPSDFAKMQAQKLANGLMKENISSLVLNQESDELEKEGLEQTLSSLRIPYTSNQSNKWNVLTKILPLYNDNGKFTCYDESIGGFIELHPNESALKNEDFILIADLNLPEHLKKYYQLNDDGFIGSWGLELFGHQKYYHTSYIDPKLLILADNKKAYFYEAGLYGLMLFGLGLDENGKEINKGHPLYGAYQNFKKVMSESKDNPWNSEQFKKENLLEYHVAQIFEKNPKLKQKVIASMNEYTVWPHYLNLKKVKGGEAFVKNLPGEDQMLAYGVSQYLKFLWAASLSTDKFYFATGIRDILPEISDSALHGIVEDVLNKSEIFLPVWDELREEIVKRVGENANLVSFDGHGSIKSFSKSVCDAQAKYGLSDKHLFRRLGFTEIDSYYQEGTQPFYQRTPQESEQMQKAATQIQRAWRQHSKQPKTTQPAKESTRTKPILHSAEPNLGGLKTIYAALNAHKYDFTKQRYVSLLDDEEKKRYLEHLRNLIKLHRDIHLNIEKNPKFERKEKNELRDVDEQIVKLLEEGMELETDEFLKANSYLNRQLIAIEKYTYTKEQIDLVTELMQAYLEKNPDGHEIAEIKKKLQVAFKDNPKPLEKLQKVVDLLTKYANLDVVSLFFNESVRMTFEKVQSESARLKQKGGKAPKL